MDSAGKTPSSACPQTASELIPKENLKAPRNPTGGISSFPVHTISLWPEFTERTGLGKIERSNQAYPNVKRFIMSFAGLFFPEGKALSSKGLFMALTRVKAIIILFSIWILATILPTVHFAPGNWTLLQLERIQDASPGMQVLLEIIGICLIVSMAILGILVVISIWKRRRKKQEDDYFIYRENPPVTWPVYVVIVLLFAGLGGIIWLSLRHADIFEDLMGPQRSVETPRVEGQHPPAPKSSTPETRRPEIHTVSSPKWRVPLILALLILLGLSLRYIFQGKPQTEVPGLKQVVQVVSNATKDLEMGTEPSDIVLRCYRDMCKILGRKVTMSRDLTAREFTKLLLQTGIREHEVTRLTDIFERVRYGHHITDPDEQAEALAMLKIIEEKYGRSSNET